MPTGTHDVNQSPLAYAREGAAAEPDEVRGRIGRAAAITKRDRGYALRALPKKKKKKSRKGKASLEK